MSNARKDVVKRLTAPIRPTNDATGAHQAARQELAWSHTAMNEYVSERARALKLPKGSAMRRELLADAGIAKDFAVIRRDRAKRLMGSKK